MRGELVAVEEDPMTALEIDQIGAAVLVMDYRCMQSGALASLKSDVTRFSACMKMKKEGLRAACLRCVISPHTTYRTRITTSFAYPWLSFQEAIPSLQVSK